MVIRKKQPADCITAGAMHSIDLAIPDYCMALPPSSHPLPPMRPRPFCSVVLCRLRWSHGALLHKPSLPAHGEDDYGVVVARIALCDLLHCDRDTHSRKELSCHVQEEGGLYPRNRSVTVFAPFTEAHRTAP
jgi:hypothetical protein